MDAGATLAAECQQQPLTQQTASDKKDKCVWPSVGVGNLKRGKHLMMRPVHGCHMLLCIELRTLQCLQCVFHAELPAGNASLQPRKESTMNFDIEEPRYRSTKLRYYDLLSIIRISKFETSKSSFYRNQSFYRYRMQLTDLPWRSSQCLAGLAPTILVLLLLSLRSSCLSLQCPSRPTWERRSRDGL